jgi:hypothetical protein
MKELFSYLFPILIIIIGVGLSLAVLYNIAFCQFPAIIGVGMIFTFLVASCILAEWSENAPS